jgi:hypothetical protein
MRTREKGFFRQIRRGFSRGANFQPAGAAEKRFCRFAMQDRNSRRACFFIFEEELETFSQVEQILFRTQEKQKKKFSIPQPCRRGSARESKNNPPQRKPTARD